MKKLSSAPSEVKRIRDARAIPEPVSETLYEKLKAFRQAAYEAFGPSRDALFELSDAVLLTPSANSFAELSLSPMFRRRWPSLYEALQDSRPDAEALAQLYAAQIPSGNRPMFVGDHTAWPRLWAPTLSDRTIEHHPTPIRGNKPITIGQGYSTLAFLPDTERAWALPLFHERIESTTDPIQKGADQLRRVCALSKTRPISLWDSEYGCAPFVKATADIQADKVIRIRPDAKNTRRDPKDLFIAWIGQPPPPLEDWWSFYLKRFLIECWYHLAKSRLYWTLPRLKTPEQSQRWSDLMPFLTWQVWLTKPLVADCPLPWQKPQTDLTPQRALQSMGGILTQIGTPARRPKPRGKSPGWPTGRPRAKYPRYEVVKKASKQQA